MIDDMDLSLLAALEVLLEEASVTRAAGRLGRSVPATSRILGRLRTAFGDPLLVRAGGQLVMTPRAEALRPRLAAVLAEARGLMHAQAFDPAQLRRRFTLELNEDLAGLLGARLIKAMLAEAPHAELRMTVEGREGEQALRTGNVDLALGSGDNLGPEVISVQLLGERFVGVAREGHPIFDKPIDPVAFAAAGQVVRSRRGVVHGPVDEALAKLGLSRRVVLAMPSAATAIYVAATTDLIAISPSQQARQLIAGGVKARAFQLPIETPPIRVALSWHPRFHADPAHRWFRERVMELAKDIAARGL